MLPFEDRFSRQRRLPEVGPSGQERLCASELDVAEHADLELELAYLTRAGVAGVAVRPAAPSLEFPWAAWFEHGAALGVARGAWCALTRIKARLPGASEDSTSTHPI